jgi:hypothetical protein
LTLLSHSAQVLSIEITPLTNKKLKRAENIEKTKIVTQKIRSTFKKDLRKTPPKKDRTKICKNLSL